MDDMQTNGSTGTTDPVKFTRERLAEIGGVWMEFAKTQVEAAKTQAESYKEKLPDALKQYLQPKPKDEAPGSTDAPSSEAV